MKAVTTPPHLPVFTGNTMRLSADRCSVLSTGAYSLQSPSRSERNGWKRSCFHRSAGSEGEQVLLRSCWCLACYPCPRSSLRQCRKSMYAATGCDRPTPFGRIPIEMSGVGENARVIGEDVLSTFADRVGQARTERKRVKWVAPAEAKLSNHQNIRKPKPKASGAHAFDCSPRRYHNSQTRYSRGQRMGTRK